MNVKFYTCAVHVVATDETMLVKVQVLVLQVLLFLQTEEEERRAREVTSRRAVQSRARGSHAAARHQSVQLAWQCVKPRSHVSRRLDR